MGPHLLGRRTGARIIIVVTIIITVLIVLVIVILVIIAIILVSVAIVVFLRKVGGAPIGAQRRSSRGQVHVVL